MTRCFYQDTVTRQRPSLVDDGHGNLEPSWSAPASLSIAGCRVQPLSSEEIAEHRVSGVEVQFRLLAPREADVLPLDRVVFGSDTFDVDGYGLRHRSPNGVAAHAEFLLRRFDG